MLSIGVPPTPTGEPFDTNFDTNAGEFWDTIGNKSERDARLFSHAEIVGDNGKRTIPDLGSCAERRGSSSLPFPTKPYGYSIRPLNTVPNRY